MANVGAEVFKLLRGAQLSPAAAAGIDGNIEQESSFDPNAPGGGLDQGQGSRAHGGTVAQQINGILGELHGSERGTLQALKGARSPQEAARIFSEKFERPGIPDLGNRERYAVEALQHFAGLSPEAGAAQGAGAGGSGPVATTTAGQPVRESAAQQQDLASLLTALAAPHASSTSPAGLPVGLAEPGQLAPIRELASASAGPSLSEELALVQKIGGEGSTERGPSAVKVPVASGSSAPATTQGNFAGGGSVPDAKGGVGFTAAPGTDYTYGHESAIANRLNDLALALGIKLTGISGYRTPAHSVAVGGFANDPHTRGEASDTPGAEDIPESVLNAHGLERPFDKIGPHGEHSNPKESDHLQLLGSVKR